MLQQKTSSTGITNTYKTSSNTKPNISPTNFETKTINSKILQNNLEQERSFYKSNFDLDLIRELTKSKSKSPNAQHNCNNSVGRTDLRRN